MCGITGFIDFNKNVESEVLLGMVGALKHRGPDDTGAEWGREEKYHWGLGHNRLSILDLSRAGHQPMQSGEYYIVFNGEIYNYKEVRLLLEKEGMVFSSECDTEVILQAYIRWGPDCVHKFIGMFSYVIYNKQSHQLHLCRDRAGVKPLYYYEDSGAFLFASELKAFHQYPGFKKVINKQAVKNYLSYGYIAAPVSIYLNTYKLEPGTFLDVNLKTRRTAKSQYWNPKDYYKKPVLDMGYAEASEEMEKLLQSACEYRMISDVPVGIFLSGGYDSSAVTALLQKTRTEKLKTFTIGFSDGPDEAPYAEQVARHLGTEHTSYYCSSKDAREIIPSLSYYYDEPCGDISCIPTMLVSRIAREHVTVALSADGGDEVFAGYNGYGIYPRKWNAISRVPLFIQPTLAQALAWTEKTIPKSAARILHKIKGLREIFEAPENAKLPTFIKNRSKIPDVIVDGLLTEPVSGPSVKILDDQLNSLMSYFLMADYLVQMPDLLLAKVDRATMSASLEGREPLLDHRLLEFAAQLPPHFKHDGSKGKIILRDIVHKYIPKEIMERPKTGFDLPLYTWLKGPLAYLVEEFLNPASLKSHGLFNAAAVLKLVKQFKTGRLIYNDIIWRLIGFQMWHKQWHG